MLSSLVRRPRAEGEVATRCMDELKLEQKPRRRNLILGVLFLLFLAAFVNYVWEAVIQGTGFPFIDLPSFWAGSVVAWEQGQSPYVFSNLEEVVTQKDPRFPVFPFLYLPQSLLILSPLVLLNYETAMLAMFVLNHLSVLLYIGLTSLLVRRADEAYPRLEVLLWSAVVTFAAHGVMVTIASGQVNFLVANCLLLSWLLLRKGRDWSGASLLVVAIALKTYPILFLPGLAMLRRWRACGAVVVWSALLTLLSWLMLPVVVWRDWWRFVAAHGGYFRDIPGIPLPSSPDNISLNGFALRRYVAMLYHFPESSPELWGGALLGLAGVLTLLSLAVLWRSREGESGGIDELFVVLLTLTSLIAPLTWKHHLVFVLPAVVYLSFNGRDWVFHQRNHWVLITACLMTSQTPFNESALMCAWLFAIVHCRGKSQEIAGVG